MPKFVINRIDTTPDQPPAFFEGSFDPQDHSIETEGDLVRRIYMEAGEGEYSILARFENPGYKVLWRGEIWVEDTEYLYYVCGTNNLAEFTAVSTPERPKIGVLKKVGRPKMRPDAR